MTQRFLFLPVLLLAMMLSFTALATPDDGQFDSPRQEQQYRELTASLRCPKCQNNSIADSNSMIAADMRQKVWQLLKEGKTPAQIKQYMIARYGQFITYDPPFRPSTLILWAGPLLFVLLGALVIVRQAGKRHTAQMHLDEAQQRRLRELLDKKGKSS